MDRSTDRTAGWPAARWPTLAGPVLGCVIALAGLASPPGAACAQTPPARRPPDEGSKPVHLGPSIPIDEGPATLAVGAPTPLAAPAPHLAPTAPVPVRLYAPSGGGSGALRAGVLADVAGGLRLAGRAVYEPRPAVTLLDVGADVAAVAGLRLSVHLASLHHLPGRKLPLRLRGRERRVTLGVRVPVG